MLRVKVDELNSLAEKHGGTFRKYAAKVRDAAATGIAAGAMDDETTLLMLRMDLKREAVQEHIDALSAISDLEARAADDGSAAALEEFFARRPALRTEHAVKVAALKAEREEIAARSRLTDADQRRLCTAIAKAESDAKLELEKMSASGSAFYDAVQRQNACARTATQQREELAVLLDESPPGLVQRISAGVGKLLAGST